MEIHNGMSGTFANDTELYLSVIILYQKSLYISISTNQSDGEDNRLCDIWKMPPYKRVLEQNEVTKIGLKYCTKVTKLD